MLIISHVVTGAVTSEVIPNYFLAIVVAFLSHFALDMIPHAQAPTDEGYVPNRKTYIVVLFDLITVLLFLICLKPDSRTLLIIFASVLPDLIDLTRYNRVFGRIFRPYYDFHDKIQRETNKPIGYISQIILILGCLIYVGVL